MSALATVYRGATLSWHIPTIGHRVTSDSMCLQSRAPARSRVEGYPKAPCRCMVCSSAWKGHHIMICGSMHVYTRKLNWYLIALGLPGLGKRLHGPAKKFYSVGTGSSELRSIHLVSQKDQKDMDPFGL